MTDPARNAALWYAQDAYDPAQKGLNGRRVAGESFLRGYLKNVDADCVQGLVNGVGAEKQFRSITQELLGQRKLETYYLTNQTHDAAINTVYYPSPNFSSEAWRRYHMGQRSFSLCGITHTTATAGVMTGMFDLRTGPVESWDGLICTSDAVLRQVEYQFDLFDEYSARRFGNSKPIRPQLARIPLGIHTDEFCPTAQDRTSLRAELGIGDDDVAFMVLSRLSANEKFDPLPMYRALALAQESTNVNVHMILCGYFTDEISKGVFQDGAKAAMPKVKLHVVDGKNAARRMQSFGAADVFMFPIDNIQETFGIAPIEAMAAGLPVIVSDWDGLKDTVSADVGFRVPTRFPGPNLLREESFRYQNKQDGYNQYTLLTASMTQLDVPYMARCMHRLIADPALRKRMGDAGRKRARNVYDWSVVIPQMQDFWKDLYDRRTSPDTGQHLQYKGVDVAISPNVGKMFKSYPTHQGGMNDVPLKPGPGASLTSLKNALKHRNFEKMRRHVASDKIMLAVLKGYLDEGSGATVRTVTHRTKIRMINVARCTYFLLKYDLLRKIG